MKRLLISESEKSRILGLYGLISEEPTEDEFATVSGVVTYIDKIEGSKPLKGVTVVFSKGKDYKVVTDSTGNFEISIPIGTYSLSVTPKNEIFSSLSKENVKIKDDIDNFDIVLKKRKNVLKNIVTKGQEILQKGGEFIKNKLIPSGESKGDVVYTIYNKDDDSFSYQVAYDDSKNMAQYCRNFLKTYHESAIREFKDKTNPEDYLETYSKQKIEESKKFIITCYNNYFKKTPEVRTDKRMHDLQNLPAPYGDFFGI